MADLSRLYAQLQNTGLQQKDNALYQVIRDLIANLIDTIKASNSGSGGTGATGQQGPRGLPGAPSFLYDYDYDDHWIVTYPYNLSYLRQGINGTVLIGVTGNDPIFSQTFALGNSINGFQALDRDGDSGITSVTAGWTATPQARFRLSRAIADPSGAQNFLIIPYQFGLACEYLGVVEWWVDQFSIHKANGASVSGGRLWVGDETDSGGLYATASDSQNWAEIASQKFTLASHGNLFFRVVNTTDSFQWNIGSAGSFAPIAILTPSQYSLLTPDSATTFIRGQLAGINNSLASTFEIGVAESGVAPGSRASIQFLKDAAAATSIEIAIRTYNGSVGGGERVRIDKNGKVGIGLTTPTAFLNLLAGIAAAGNAPLKFTAGINLTSPEAGAIEWDGTNLFATQTTGPTRKTIAYTTDIPSFPSIVASTFEKAETGSDANVLTYAVVAGSDQFLTIQVAVDISALTGTSVAATATWRDSNNATQTSTVTLSGVTDGSINIPINAKASTNVVVSTVFVGVSTAYNISAFITRLK